MLRTGDTSLGSPRLGKASRAEAEEGSSRMRNRRTTKLAPLILAATVVLTGCATIRRSHAHDAEQLLAAAGFKMQLADTVDQQRGDAGPPYRLMSRTKDGAVEYTYADPENCKCVYVGGSKEYSEYQRLATERRIARERRWVAEDGWGTRNYWGGPWGVWSWGP